MAYLPTYNTQAQDDEDLKKPILSGEGGTVQGRGSPSLTTAPVTPPGSGEGTGFVDLRRYLEQNETKTSGLADRIGGDVEGRVGEVEGSIAEGGSVFDTEARERNAIDPEFVKSTLADPLKAVADPLALDRFTGLRTGTYRGPGSMDTSPYTNDITQAQMMGEQTQNTEGLEDLMSGYSADPTKGKSGLNNALLGQSSYAQNRLDEAQGATNALNDYLSNAVSGSEDVVRNIGEGLQANMPAVQEAIDARSSQFDTDLATGYEAAIYEALSKINEPIYQENLRRNDINFNDRSPQEWADFEFLDTDIPGQLPVSYYHDAPATRDVWASSNPELYAIEKALETLAGKKYDYIPDTATGEDVWGRRVDYLTKLPVAAGEIWSGALSQSGRGPQPTLSWQELVDEQKKRNGDNPFGWDLGG